MKWPGDSNETGPIELAPIMSEVQRFEYFDAQPAPFHIAKWWLMFCFFVFFSGNQISVSARATENERDRFNSTCCVDMNRIRLLKQNRVELP